MIAAGTTVLAARMLGAGTQRCRAPLSSADDGMRLHARLTTTRIVVGADDQNLAPAVCLIEQLDPADVFTVVAYSTGVEVGA